MTRFLTISINIFLNRFAGPHDHLCCWYRNALNVLGSSLLTWNNIYKFSTWFIQGVQSDAVVFLHEVIGYWCIFTLRSPRYTNFHPLRLALTARSMSSTVVRSFQPPASFRADMRHTPAVPVKQVFCMLRRRIRWCKVWLLAAAKIHVQVCTTIC